ncbi:MAG: hypothetical protein ACQEW8_15550 [Actinomycetota bacterium]
MNFDDGVADRLIAACDGAATTLGNQRGPRESVVGLASGEFRGVFADAFRSNVDAERGARTGLIGALESVVQQASAAKQDAQIERDRREALAAAESRSMVVQSGMIAADSSVLALDPRVLLPETPRPTVSVGTVRQALRAWPSGRSSSGSSSADPDDLESAVSVMRVQNDAADGACDTVVAAVGAFEDACGWAFVDLDGLRGGLRRFMADNRGDSSRLEGIAAAFRAAGGDGDIGPVALSDTALVLATVPGSLTPDGLLSFLSSASDDDIEALASASGWQAMVQAVPPEKIARWWAGMNPAEVWGADGGDAVQRSTGVVVDGAVFGVREPGWCAVHSPGRGESGMAGRTAGSGAC